MSGIDGRGLAQAGQVMQVCGLRVCNFHLLIHLSQSCDEFEV